MCVSNNTSCDSTDLFRGLFRELFLGRRPLPGLRPTECRDELLERFCE